jgi:predicted RecA/RadA family phage recombinase
MTVPAPANVASGEGVRVGVLFGVAVRAAQSGQPVEIATRGVFTLPKVSAQAWTVGAAIYWAGASGCTTVAGTGNILIGVAAAVADNPSATGLVRLNGAAPAAQT